jgi:hypothetical protein
MPRKRPPPIVTTFDRAEVAFTKSFAQLVLDVFILAHYNNPDVQNLRRMRLDDPTVNAARLHTFPFRAINQGVQELVDLANQRAMTQAQLKRFTMFACGMIGAGRLLRARVKRTIEDNSRIDRLFGTGVLVRIERNIERFERARSDLLEELANQRVGAATQREFMRAANNFIGNVYDLGPHRGGNLAVLDRWHLNLAVRLNGTMGMSPISWTLYVNMAGFAEMSVPVTPRGTHIVGHRQIVSPRLLSPRTEGALRGARFEPVNADRNTIATWDPFRSTQSGATSVSASLGAASSSLTALSGFGARTVDASSSTQPLGGTTSTSSTGSATSPDRAPGVSKKRRPAVSSGDMPLPKKPLTSSGPSTSSSSEEPSPAAQPFASGSSLDRLDSMTQTGMEDESPRASSQSVVDDSSNTANPDPLSWTNSAVSGMPQPFEIESPPVADPFVPVQSPQNLGGGSASSASRDSDSDAPVEDVDIVP